MTLKGKIAFVTGGSRGIGKAICLKLVENGAFVGFLYRSSEDCAQQVCQLIREKGGQALAFKGNVLDRKLLVHAFSQIQSKWGQLDILVNNAGVNKPADFDQISDADWEEVLAVNLKGPFVCCQEALPFFNDGGSIIHIGSVSGQYGGPRTAHYAASKAGLISLSQVIARFGAKRKIRSNTIAAGLIQSEMAAAGLQAESVKKAAASIPLEELGRPEDVAEAVIFLGSDASRYITAQTINVNGGLYF